MARYAMRLVENHRTVWWIYAPSVDGTVRVSKAFTTTHSKYGENDPAVVPHAEAVEMWEFGRQRGGVRERNPRVCADLYVIA